MKAAQRVSSGEQLKKFDDKTLGAHLKNVRDAQAEIPFRFRWMLFNRAVDKLIEKPKAEQGDAEDVVHLAVPSVAAFIVHRRKSDDGPLDAQLGARGCKADVIPRHGEEMCTVAGGPTTWKC